MDWETEFVGDNVKEKHCDFKIGISGWAHFNHDQHLIPVKVIFLSSLTCAITSLFGLLALSAITFVPTSRATGVGVMLGMLISLVFWILLAIWARVRMGISTLPSAGFAWVERASMLVAIAYVFGILLFVVG
jgi:hypothetical protein